MARRILLVLLLGSVTRGAGPGFKDIFKAFSSEFPTGAERSQLKRAAFGRELERQGPAKAIRHFAACEDALEDIAKQLDKDLAVYRKQSGKWWEWRRKYERDHERKYKRPPAEYPVPKGLNDAFIAAELRLKKTRSLLMRERLFHEWAFAQVAGLAPKADREPLLRACGAELKDRNPHQRLRAAKLIELLPGPDAAAAVDAAIKRERVPAVLGALLEARAAVAPEAAPLVPFLSHDAWAARAGAMAALGAAGGREAVDALVARLQLETGRLRDDATDALRRLSGQDLGSDPAAWRSWWKDAGAGWQPRAPAADAPRETFSDGPVRIGGIATGSRALVFCLDGGPAWGAVREAMKQALDTIPAGAKFGIVINAGEPKVWKRKLATTDPAARKSAAAFLDAHEPEAETDLYAALLAGLDVANGAADTMVVVQPVPPQEPKMAEVTGLIYDPRHIALEINALNALRGIRIHAIGRSGGAQAYYLQQLAAPFRGAFRGPE
jgi:hypothetical protein